MRNLGDTGTKLECGVVNLQRATKPSVSPDPTPWSIVFKSKGIGRIAKRVGLNVDAIRFYERTGLLPRPPRTERGFRRHVENDVETLAFVRRVQGFGCKLSEIPRASKMEGMLASLRAGEAAIGRKVGGCAAKAWRSPQTGA